MSDEPTEPIVSEREIFLEALKHESPAARAAYLDQACGNRAATREAVETLLRHHKPDDFMMPKGWSAPLAPITEKAGDQIGPYKLLQQIGEGGCGVVYMAEQETPLRRRVALKVIKLGMDTRQVMARFEAERQALAMMDHPNIAKALDAGATAAGRPYFVMELVRGIRITDYCDQNNLSTEERLKLFMQVCRAIQHAHQKGIIHRDIKPSNILVTMHDGVPVPKVIDFGIAKATEGRLTDLTLFTAFEQFIGTPAYMSPEQAEMSGLDIDTRSDVYALGVLLYELLTGKTPFDPKELLKAGLDEIRRAIREVDPARPSTRLGTMTALDLGAVAKRRQTDSPKLLHKIRGDLDWIVMKCLEKDRTRRYETANGLATDIQRHLSQDAVSASPPSRMYRLQKVVRRHRLLFATVSAVAVALVIGVAVSSWQAVRATRAERNEHAARQGAEEARAREAQQRGVAEENARLARAREQQASELAYAADMKLASQAWDDGNLFVMSRLLEAHQPRAGAPDGRGFEFFYLQQLARGEQDFVLRGHTNPVLGVAVSPDGKWLATRSQTDTRLWDLSRRALASAWSSTAADWPGAGRCRPSFSYDSQCLVIQNAAGLRLARIPTLESQMIASGPATRAVFAPNKPQLAFNSDMENSTGARLHVWDYAADKELASAPGDEIWQWSPDGARLLGGQGGGCVYWWEASTLRCVATNYAAQYVKGAAVSRDGSRMAVADWQGEVAIVDTASGRALVRIDTGDIRPSALAFSPDGQTLATPSKNQAITLWNVNNGRRLAEWRGHRGKVEALAYTPDGQWLVSGGADAEVMLWNVARETNAATIPNHLRYYGAAGPVFSPDGSRVGLVTGDNGHGRTSSAFSTATWEAEGECPGEIAGFAPDGRQWAVAEQEIGWKFAAHGTGAATNRAVVYLDTGEFKTVTTPQLSPDGTLVACTVLTPERQPTTVVCDAATGQRTLTLTNSGMGKGFFPKDQSWITLNTDDSTIRFWDLRTGKNTRTLKCGWWVSEVKGSPDGKYLAATIARFVFLWDLEAGNGFRQLEGHQDEVQAIAFSADSRTLASCSEDRTVRLWSLSTRRELACIPQEKAVYWLAFSPDNQTLVAGGIGAYHLLRAPQGEPAVWKPGPMRAESARAIWAVADGVQPLTPAILAHYRTVAERGGLHERYVLGRILARGDGVAADPREAELWFQRASEAPAAELNDFAWTLATSSDARQRDARRAVQFAERAVAADGGANNLNTLGVARYEAGDFRGALAALEKCVQLEGQGTAWDFFFLSMAHARLGETAAARVQYDEGVRWSAQHESNNQELAPFRREAMAALHLAP
ncbi:MAG TPA: protein kinase [Verrucomicrobiae bacterium]|jgi:serine/threonine protein kinase/WD40 repeat protein|nr:protein kinase [Verrucomicrobiae bacterium]